MCCKAGLMLVIPGRPQSNLSLMASSGGDSATYPSSQRPLLESDLTLSYSTLNLLFFTLWPTEQFIPHTALLTCNYKLLLHPSAPAFILQAKQSHSFFRSDVILVCEHSHRSSMNFLQLFILEVQCPNWTLCSSWNLSNTGTSCMFCLVTPVKHSYFQKKLDISDSYSDHESQ